MSTTIDQRVAELRFDNSHFEKNVSTTMSTLDKLKEKLHLTGASKGLEDVGSAAKKIDMSGLANGVETVKTKFSALEVMGVTALANITNSAVNAGKRIVKSLTIDPVTTGWNEYELKMGSIQTIMASTGESLETVNQYLNELNEYSDKTIYSFSDMTQNIGKFTNAGVKLEDAVMAIKGISNEAAVSGANANEASRAMYNFAQALSAGYVKLIDWKSIENANMATVEFKEQLIEAAVAAGTLEKQADGMYKVLTTNAQGSTMGGTISATKMFNDSLNYQWMTTEVLVNTLKDYADETTEIGKKATQAATEVKTFSQMMDALKESAQSGWAQTWEIIFGDFEEGKTLWTNINNVVGGFIDKMSDARNALATNIFGNSWDKLILKIKKAGLSAKDFEEAVKSMGGKHVKDMIKQYGSLSKAVDAGRISTSLIHKAFKKFVGVEEDVSEATDDVTMSVEELNEIVKKVMRGDFANGETRVKKLTEAGYDWATVQNRVNELMGSSVRHISSLTEEQLANANSLAKLSEEQLKEKGYTEEQIIALKDLGTALEDADSDINKLIESMGKPSGRSLVIESFSNAFKYFSEILGIVGEAWDEVFGDINLGDSLYNVIEKIHEFTESLVVSEDQAERFHNILKGVFSAFDLSWSLASASLMGGLKILNEVLKLFGTDLAKVLEFAANQVTKLNEWVEGIAFFGSNTKWSDFAKAIHAVLEGIRDCIRAFFELERFQGVVKKVKGLLVDIFDFDTNINFLSIEHIVTKIRDFFDNIENWIRGMDSAENLGTYIIEGLYNGLKNGISKIAGIIIEVATTLVEAFCDFFGIHSPSKLMFALGGFLILGLINGIKDGNGSLVDIIKGLASSVMTAFEDIIKNGIPELGKLVSVLPSKILEYIKDLDLGTILATGFGVGMFITSNKIIDVIDKIVNPLDALGDLIDNVSGILGEFKGAIKNWGRAKLIDKIGDTVLHMAISIGILAGSLWLIAKIPSENLWESVKAIGALSAIVAGLAGVAALIEKFGGFSFSTFSIVGFAASVLILTTALKKLSDIENVGKVAENLSDIIFQVGLLFIAMSFLTAGDIGNNLDKAGKMFFGLSVSMLILAVAMKQIGKLESSDILKGIIVIGVLELFFITLTAVARTSGESVSKVGGMLVKMSIAILLLVGIIKMIGLLDYGEVVTAIPVIAAIELLFAGIIAVSRLAGENAGKAGLLMLGMAAALGVAVICIEKIAGLNQSDINKGIAAIAALEVLFAGLIAVSYIAGKHAAGAGAMLLSVAGSLLMLTAVIFILGQLDPKKMWTAIGAIAVLEGLFGGLIFLTKYAKDSKGMNGVLVKLMITIGLLAGILIALSYLDPQKLAIATASLSAVMGVFALLIAATKYIETGDKTWKRSLITIGILTGVVMALGAVISVLSIIANPNSVLHVAGSISILLLSLVAALRIISETKTMTVQKLERSMKALLVMTGVVAILGVVLGVMSALDAEASIGTAVALGILLNAMAVAFNILNKSTPPTKNIYNTIGAMAALGLVVGEMGLILGLLNKYDMHASLSQVVNLSAMLMAMTIALRMLDGVKSSNNIYSVVGAMAALGLVVGEMGLILGLLNKYDMHASLGDVAALSIMLTAMTGILILLGATSAITSLAWGGIGALAVLGLVVGEMGLILGLLKKHDMMASIDDVNVISTLLLSMSAALVVLGVVGAMAGFVGIGMSTLIAFVASLTVLLAALGGLSKIPGVRDLLVDGGSMLALIGEAIGGFFGSIVSGFTTEIISTVSKASASLPDIGDNLSTFMTKVSGFIEGAKAIDGDAMDGINSLIAMIGLISGANIIEKINSFISGESSMDTFAAQICKFGDAIIEFSDKVKGKIDEESVLAAANAGKLLAEMQSMMQGSGGLIQEFAGEKNLENFATQIVAFGDAIVAFSDTVSADDGIDEDAVKAAANAGKLITELQSSIEPMNGVIQQFTGEKNLELFGSQLVAYGKAIVEFSKAVSSEGAINEEAITAAKNAGLIMTELQSAIKPTGGLLEFFTGKKGLDNFGVQLAAYGLAISAFSKSISGENAIDEGTITAAANAGKVMAEVQKGIPEDKWLDGKMSIDDFGKKIKKFGKSMKDFSDEVLEIDSEAVSNSTSAAKSLVKIAQSADDIDTDKIDNFDKVKNIGSAIKDYSDKVTDIDANTISSSISAISRLVHLINSMANINASGVSTFNTAISSLAKTNIGDITKSFSNATPTLVHVGMNLIDAIAKGMTSRQSALNAVSNTTMLMLHRQLITKTSMFQQAGVTLINKFASGLVSGKSKVSTAARTPITGAISSIRSFYSSFYSAGSYLVSGFANGISANTWRAAAKARAMANAAEKAAKEALDINSPSRVFQTMGRFIPEGFAIGIDKMSYMASDSASGMASTAITGVKDAISRISDYMNGDIDSQPTIRPVLDLSDVKAGANSINGMFGMAPSVGVMSNINSISSIMNQRNQNGANSDIISELSKLRKDLSNVGGGNTYQINGITYDDGSAVSEAIGTLIRATRIDGRA